MIGSGMPSPREYNDEAESQRFLELFPVLANTGCTTSDAAGSHAKDAPFTEGDTVGSCSKNVLTIDEGDDAGLSTAYTSPNLPNNWSASPLMPVPSCFITHFPERVLNLGLPPAVQSEPFNDVHAIMERTSKWLGEPTAPSQTNTPFAQLDVELCRENAEACVKMKTKSKSSDDEDAPAWGLFWERTSFLKPSHPKKSSHVDLDLVAHRQDAVIEFMKGRWQLLLTLLPEWKGQTARRVRHVVFGCFVTKIQAAWRGYLLRTEFAVPLAAAVMVDRVVDKIWGSFSEQSRSKVCTLLRNRAIDEWRAELAWVNPSDQTSVLSLRMTIENLQNNQVHQADAARTLQAWWRGLLENPTPFMRRFWCSMEFL